MSRKLVLRTLNIDVPTAGTRVQITTVKNTQVSFIRFTADKGNTNGVFFGDSDVDSTYAQLNAADAPVEYWSSQRGDLASGPWFDLSDWWLDSDNDGNNVIVEYYLLV